MVQYRWTVSDETDATFTAKAAELGISKSELLRNAVNMYCTLKKPQYERVYVQERVDGKLQVKRVEIP